MCALRIILTTPCPPVSSCFPVPPTSIPRQSGPGAGELLHWLVVEVVAERPWPGERDTALGPPDGITGKGDHGHPLAVPDRLGGYRLGGLAVQYRDQVRHRGERPATLECHQVLVLQFQPDQPTRVLT